MRVNFNVDGTLVYGAISPRSQKPSLIAGASHSVFEISFEASPEIASRIHHYVDSLSGDGHMDKVMRSFEGDKAYSFTRYFGSQTYVSTFYETLGLNLPALNEGREPTTLEIINFVHPAVAAAAAAVDHAEALPLFEECTAEELELTRCDIQVMTSRMALRALQVQMPAPAVEIMAEAIANLEASEALYLAQKDICSARQVALAPHLPTILVPAVDEAIAPIGSNSYYSAWS
jgi:hypothetical protein